VARLLADENFPLPAVEALRRLGHDVVTLADLGHSEQALGDQAVLQIATSDRRAVATLNRRHFIRLHTADSSYAGIIACTFDLDFEGQARRIDAAIGGLEPLAGRLFRVNREPTSAR
jgi:Domain of unknown function (DUF5615)